MMAEEMGKPIGDGMAEAQKCAAGCDYYAENAERFLAPEPVQTEARKSFIAFNPLGVVLAIMLWNFPFWQVFRFAAPGLMAGNAAVLKHASNVPGCALAIERVFRKGVPRAPVSNPVDRQPGGRRGHRESFGASRDPHREPAAGRAVAGKASAMPQEDRPRARR
jgi:succinate-semialdehyde dehydrogenase/glutarate-semialdehyde dehydrogenase